MKIRGFGRHGGKTGPRAGSLAAALALAVALAALGSARALTARAVDLEGGCALTVLPGSQEFTADLTSGEEEALVFDLYKVAEAVGLDGSDGYRFEAADAFAGMAIPTDADTEAWRGIAQEAARRALVEKLASPVVTGASPLERIEATDAGDPLGTGLYLVVARGTDPGEDYVEELPGEAGTGEAGQVVTVAHSAEYSYTFSPELVALPAKESPEGQPSTATPGDWVYDLTVAMKPAREVRYGALEIVKTLLTHETREGHEAKDPATFVFDVEAALDGRTVYSDVVSLTFTEAGSQTRRIEGLPVGAEVTVTEVYSGSSYKLTTEESRTAVIPAAELEDGEPGGAASVSFTNDYTREDRRGRGIENQFEYEEGSGWSWAPLE